jgi:hypothetical protein
VFGQGYVEQSKVLVFALMIPVAMRSCAPVMNISSNFVLKDFSTIGRGPTTSWTSENADYTQMQAAHMDGDDL